MDLPISAEQRAMVSIELGMALIDSGDLKGARTKLTQTTMPQSKTVLDSFTARWG